MKNVKYIMTITLITLFCLVVFDQSTHAQTYTQTFDQSVTQPGDLTIGAGLSYGNGVGHLENSEIGISLQLFYGITEKIRGGIDYTYFFIGENDLGASEINLNGHYFIRNRDNLIIYALGGLNLSRIKADSDVWGNVSSSDIGINAGLGLEIDFGNFAIFGEPKYTIGGWNQFMTTAGVRMRI